MISPNIASSLKISGICAAATSLIMILFRPVFRYTPETTFLGGIFGSILFFFLLIWYGNFRDRRGSNELGWVSIGLCEFGALLVSYLIHPVCITTCFLFSILVVIYIKWASTKLRNNRTTTASSKKTK